MLIQKLEQTIAAIWQDVLTIDHIGIHENFFQLGGDSLALTSMIAKLGNQELPLDVKKNFQMLFTQDENRTSPERAKPFLETLTIAWLAQQIHSTTHDSTMHDFQKTAFETSLSYWRQQLLDMPVPLELPTDRPRPAVQSFDEAYYSFIVPDHLTQRLLAASQREGVTLFMLLLTAFNVLLFRYTQQEDIIVGTLASDHMHSELDNSTEYFENILALRTNLSGSPTFSQLLNRVRKTTLEAYAYQDLSFEKIVEELAFEKFYEGQSIFQTGFVLLNKPQLPDEPVKLEGKPFSSENQTVKLDLTLEMTIRGRELQCVVEYRSELFDITTITRMMGSLQILLESAVSNPEQPITELSILTPSERQQILAEWNDTNADYPTNKCINQLFEDCSEITPDAIAAVFGEEHVTYSEFNLRANQLAHYLQVLKVGPEVLVGIYMERSLELSLSLLAILKAGGAYVPVDLSYPLDRLSFIIDDAHILILLTQKKLCDVLSRLGIAIQVIPIDAHWETITLEAVSNTKSGAIAENIAYVVYTSGSTGKPKGVSVSHRAVSRLVCNMNYVQLTPSSRVAQALNISFDAAVFEVWGPLLNGAQIVGVPQNVLLSPHDLEKYLSEQQISVLLLTTALFNEIAFEAPWILGSLQYSFFGGDAADPKWVKQILKHGRPGRLQNMYGPSESTTFTSFYVIQDIPDETTTIPIGRPVLNTSIYVLDQQLQPVPIGVSGELYIGGDGLARNYLNRPELTAERFVPHPLSQEAGARLYKTGDMVRYRGNGDLEFLGRFDNQVKIRGYRIELGEIEIVLSRYPAIRDVVVLAREDTPNDKRLVAYFVAKQTPPMARELRTYLRKQLPDYMVPSYFIPLEAFPLTPNGKINRRGLPLPERPKYRQS